MKNEVTKLKTLTSIPPQPLTLTQEKKCINNKTEHCFTIVLIHF